MGKRFEQKLKVGENFIDYIKQYVGPTPDKKITARDLAEKVGVTEVSMSRYLNKERNISIDIAIKICNVLGISKNQFINFYSEYFENQTTQDENNIEERFNELYFIIKN